MEKSRFTRLRFTYEDDLVLLREFLNVNPVLNPEGWDAVQRNIATVTGKNFLIKTLKQHLQLLIEIFLKKVKVDEIRSGIEEPLCEKNSLLQEVTSLCQEYNYDFKQKKKSLTKEQRLVELGKRAREDNARACLDSHSQANSIFKTIMNEPVTESKGLEEHNYFFGGDIVEEEIIVMEENNENHPQLPPTPDIMSYPTPSTSKTNNANLSYGKKILGPHRSRKNRGEPFKKNTLLYLTEKNERDNRIKLKELSLEERRISLEERKMELAEKELKLKEKEIDEHHKEVMLKLEIDKKRADVEVEEKKLANQLMLSQQMLIDQLLKRQ